MGEPSFFVWKDVIVLKPGTTLIPDEAGLKDYPELEPFGKFSKKFQGFIFSFGVGNLKRIHDSFGKIPVTGGRHYIEKLRQSYREFQIDEMRAVEIKNLPIEDLPKINYKIPPLGDYQHRETIYLCEIPSAPLFADCGLGKTFCVLVSTEEQIRRGIVPRGKVLIAAKLATLFGNWMEDAAKFTDLKVSCLWAPSGKKKKEKVLRMLEEDADVYLINHEGVRVYEDALAAKGFHKVVVDESTILKSFRSERSQKGGAFGKALMNVSRNAKWRVVMSGTPAPNGVHDLWGQFKFIDPMGFKLEPSFYDFRNLYMEEIIFGRDQIVCGEEGKELESSVKKAPSTWRPTRDGTSRVSEIIKPLSFRVRMEDHLKDLPPKTTMERTVELSVEQEEHYSNLAKEFFTTIGGETITVSMKLTLMGKFRQITGGFLYDEFKDAHPIDGENPKLDEMDSILSDEIGKKKVIVFAQYSYEIETLYSRYKDRNPVTVYGGNSSKVNFENMDRFKNDPSVLMIILHPKSAAHGVNLTNAHYMIFYSMSFSAEEDYQAVKRIERAGQKNAMIVYYLLCEDSIDEYIFDVVQRKHKAQAELIDSGRVLSEDSVANELWGSMINHLTEKYPKLSKLIQRTEVINDTRGKDQTI